MSLWGRTRYEGVWVEEVVGIAKCIFVLKEGSNMQTPPRGVQVLMRMLHVIW